MANYTQWGTVAKHGKVKESTLKEGNCSTERLNELRKNLTSVFNEVEQDGAYSTMAKTIVNALFKSRLSSEFLYYLGKRILDRLG